MMHKRHQPMRRTPWSSRQSMLICCALTIALVSFLASSRGDAHHGLDSDQHHYTTGRVSLEPYGSSSHVLVRREADSTAPSEAEGPAKLPASAKAKGHKKASSSTATPKEAKKEAKKATSKGGKKTDKGKALAAAASARPKTKKKSGQNKATSNEQASSKPSPLATKANESSKTPQEAQVGHYETRDVAYFLESQQAQALHDPRAYFTGERTSRSLSIMLHELSAVPERLRFAWVMRIFHELGRKIASKLNIYGEEVLALLRKGPDGLGSKPGEGTYVDVVTRAFESKGDRETAPIQAAAPRARRSPESHTAPTGGGGSKSIKWPAPHTRHTQGTGSKLGRKSAPPALQQAMKNRAVLSAVANIATARPSEAAAAAATVAVVAAAVASERERANGDYAITNILAADEHKATMFNASSNEIAIRFAKILSHFVVTASKSNLLPSDEGDKMATVLGEALKDGARTMIAGAEGSPKYRVARELVKYMNRILNKTVSVFKGHVRDKTDHGKSLPEFGALQTHSFQDLNPITDRQGPTGFWNSYLFDNLGTSERVVKLFGSLLARVPAESKSRYVNLYHGQVERELNRTMSSFVAMQSLPYLKEASEKFLLLDMNQTSALSAGNATTLGSRLGQFAQDKNRMPARCYLAGRRWRLSLSRALRDYSQKEEVINMFAAKINQLKVAVAMQAGNDLDRLCLPRLEVGLKGWGINGDPPGEINVAADKFPLRSPIEGLNTDEDPFTSGARMGYRLGFMVGYNEKRNASLEMESARTVAGTNITQARPVANNRATVNRSSAISTNKKASANAIKLRSDETENSVYLAKASYRRGLTAGARQALEIGCREGYMASLKVSLRAGMLLPLEAGSRLASLKASNFARLAGGEAGLTFINSYLMDRHNVDEQTRRQLIALGRSYGSLAGQTIGETIGAIVGRESALEAYRRAVTRAGKVVRAKFQLEEFEAGAKAGFEHGIGEGGRVAMLPNLDPSAPTFFKFSRPKFESPISEPLGGDTSGEKSPSNSASSSSSSTEHWEKDLITPLTPENIEHFHATRNHTRVVGSLKGKYTVSHEVKKGLEHISYNNETYNLEVNAIGFIMNEVAYLSLSGKINGANVLRGSLIARNIISGHQ